MNRITITLLLFAGIWAPRTHIDCATESQVAIEQEEEFTLELLDEGMNFEEFAELYAQMTGRRVFWDARRVQNKSIRGQGPMRFKKSDMERVFRNIFHAHGMAVLPTGDPDLNMVMLEDIKTSQLLKQMAQFITIEDLFTGPYGSELVTVLVPVRHADPDMVQRALNNMIQDHRAGYVHPLVDEHALLITNFGHVVRTLVRTVQAIDARSSEFPKKTEQNLPRAEPLEPGEGK